jgi:localization factor PodJL
MAKQTPWSVKGVRPECREAAKVAARRSNLTIGEWLNAAIMNAAKQSVQGQDVEPANHQLPALPLSELTQAIETLSEGIRLQVGRNDKDTGVDRAVIEETVAPVAESVRRLEESVDAKINALELGDQVGPMQGRMQAAEAQAERANLALAPLERKIMRMAQEMEKQKTLAIHEPQRRGLLSRMFGR